MDGKALNDAQACHAKRTNMAFDEGAELWMISGRFAKGNGYLFHVSRFFNMKYYSFLNDFLIDRFGGW